MALKEAIKFLISFGQHTFEIIVYLLPFSTAFDFIFGLNTLTDIEGKSNYSKMEFKFQKISMGITLSKYIHLPVGETTALDSEMVKNPPRPFRWYSSSKMKLKREDCLPQTLKVALVNGKMHMNITNTCQGELHPHRGQHI